MPILLFVFFLGNNDWGQCQESLTKERIISAFTGRVPQEWGEIVGGIKTRLNTDQKVLALTFDACAGPRSLSYDAKLIQYLEAEKIPATLFISGR